MEKKSNYRYGIRQDRRDIEPLPKLTIRELQA